MGDILSQSEIDALLSALSDGQVDAEEMRSTDTTKKVRVYDFKRPNKFSKDQIHSLQNIYENYCRALTNFLSGNLHSAIESKVLSIEQNHVRRIYTVFAKSYCHWNIHLRTLGGDRFDGSEPFTGFHNRG